MHANISLQKGRFWLKSDKKYDGDKVKTATAIVGIQPPTTTTLNNFT